MIFSEYGVILRNQLSDHSPYRIYWNEVITETAKAKGLVSIYWDSGHAGNYGFSLFNRSSGAQLNPSLINAIINAGN